MRLVRLVGDLEQLAQAEAAPQLELETLDLSGVTKQTVDTFQIQFQKKGVSLLPNLSPGVYVRGDRDKLVQVLVNLLSNALKYTPSDGRVTVDVMEKGNRAVVSITDTGSGIPESDLPFIFERFYRGDKSRTRATGGAGIGLSIVKALVQAHGGQVSVESKVGTGSAFSVVLPLIEQGEGRPT
jgi:signal transduction histidine kinase